MLPNSQESLLTLRFFCLQCLYALGRGAGVLGDQSFTLWRVCLNTCFSMCGLQYQHNGNFMHFANSVFTERNKALGPSVWQPNHLAFDVATVPCVFRCTSVFCCMRSKATSEHSCANQIILQGCPESCFGNSVLYMQRQGAMWGEIN